VSRRRPCDALGYVPLRCLIVDDNLEFGRAAGKLLEDSGIVVVGIATSGDSAVRHVEELQPDVALLDINLGAESGFEVAQRLAELPRAVDPPAMIFISTDDGAEYAELIEASPAVGFVHKTDLSAHAIHAVLADGDEPLPSG
jgi:CheY-like chemotaxis protein